MAPLKNFTSHNIYHLTCGGMDGWIANSGSKYFNLIMIARDSSLALLFYGIRGPWGGV